MQDLDKTLRTLHLPSSAAAFDGLTGVTTTRTIVNKVLNDLTKMVNGKPTVTSTFEVVETKTAANKIYTLNYLNMMGQFGLIVTNDDVNNFVMSKPRTWATINAGPFSGQTYWYPEQTIIIKPTNAFYTLDLITDLGMNSTTTGYPDPSNGEDPLVTIRKEIYVKTSTFYSSKPSISYPKYGLKTLCSLMNTTPDELKYATRMSCALTTVDTNKRIANTSVEGIFSQVLDTTNIEGNIHVYYNGIDTSISKPSGLLTSYDKTYPGHVVRWRLYNGVVKDAVYGSSVTIKFDSSENNTINIVAGVSASYDIPTRTLTYDKSKEAILWATFEELPAQGKNWGGEALYLLVENQSPIKLSK